jgi:ABC-type branched-subunit amino acid transport system ATPase component
MLEIRNMTKSFGGLTAVGDFSMRVSKGEFMGVIGPNGAGKTTLINLITASRWSTPRSIAGCSNIFRCWIRRFERAST